MAHTAHLYVPARADLAAAAVVQDVVRFEGVAVGLGIYAAQGGEKIAITAAHLPLIADRIRGVQIRDLHDDRVRATVGAVREASVVGSDVRFVGEVALQPHATIIRRFPETIAFSVGFRFRREDLVFDASGVAPLPLDFVIDHLALVAQGQDPDARLTRLLNQAAAHPNLEGLGNVDQREFDRMRTERDQALGAAEKAKADLAVAKADLGRVNDQIERGRLDLEAARKEADEAKADLAGAQTTAGKTREETEAAKLELQRAKAHFANSIIKLELKTDKDVELDERRAQLLALSLGGLDKLRLDLAAKAAQAAAPRPGAGEPATRPGGAAKGGAAAGALDLEKLSFEDTLRLGLVKGAI